MESGTPGDARTGRVYLRLISMGALLTLHLTAAAERPPHDAEDRMGVCCRLQSHRSFIIP